MVQRPEAHTEDRVFSSERLLLIALLVAVGLFTVWSRVSEYQAVRRDAQQLLEDQSTTLAQAIGRELEGIASGMRGVRSGLPAWKGADLTAFAGRRMGALATAVPGLESMTLLDASGRVLASSQPDWVGQDFSGQPFFVDVRRQPDPGIVTVSAPAPGISGQPTMHLGIALTDPGGAFDGVITASLDAREFRAVLKAQRYAEDAWVVVGRGDGLFFMDEPDHGVPVGTSVDRPGSLFRRLKDSGQRALVVSGVVAVTGESRMMAQRLLQPDGFDHSFDVAVSRRLDAIYAAWRSQTEVYAILYVLLAASAVLVQHAIARRQSRIAQLEAEQLEVQRRAAQRMELALQGADLGLWELDVRTGTSFVDARWNSMLGLPNEPSYPDSDGWRTRVHPDDLPRVIAARDAALQGRTSRFDEVYRMRHVDGHWVWLVDRANVVEYDAEGRPLRMVGTHMDVTASRLQEEALRDSQDRLRTLLDNLRTGAIVHDAQGHIVDANAAACLIVGLPLEELKRRAAGDGYWKLMEEDGSPMPIERFPALQVLRSGRTLHSFVVGLHRDGRSAPSWALVDAYPHRGPAGEIDQVVVTLTDITERKQAGDQLRLLGTAVSKLNDVVIITEASPLEDPGPRILFVNDAFEHVTGWKREEVVGRSPRLLQGPATDQATTARIGAALRRSEPVSAELLNYRKGGQPYWVELSIAPIRDSHGAPTHLVAVQRDITQRRRSDQALQRLNRSLRVLSSSNVTLVEGQDETGYMTKVCDAVVSHGGYLMAWIGVARDDPGRTVSPVARAGVDAGYLDTIEISWDEGRPEGQGPTGMTIRSGATQVNQDWETNPRMAPWRKAALRRGYRSSISLPLKDGTRTFGALTLYAREPDAFDDEEVAPLEELAHQVSMGVVSLRTRRERDQADRASRAKTAFLANMSHEIRTPLNAILGLNYLLRHDGVTPAQAQRLEKIDNAGQHLLSLINDILDLSKIEAGRMQIERADFHLDAVLDNVRSIILEPARAKGLALTVDSDGVPPWLRGDPTRLRQALLNFASNAVKFTRTGSIALRCEMLDAQGDQMLVRFSVQDTGPGIAPQEQLRLFKAFEQLDASTSREHGGSGLGLVIARRLAELMGGECGVESTPGAGSTFWFTAWLEHARSAMPAQVLEPVRSALAQLQRRHAGARVLLAEDNEVNREVALAVLDGVGMRVDVAGDGREAADKACAADYDLVLMDVQMPLMSGLDAARLIRERRGPRPAIIALTANAFAEDRQACIEAGMNDFIAKPMNVDSLYETLLRWLDAGKRDRMPDAPA